MRDFNVLLTCCGQHISERIDCLKNNEDKCSVKVYACNSNYDNLPLGCDTDGNFVVPAITATDYISTIINLCKELSIDIIIPTVTLELEFMSRYAQLFRDHGIHVSVSSHYSILLANDKLAMHKAYGDIMPKTIVVTGYDDLLEFEKSLGEGATMCCKLTDHCGGNGFAIIDDEKACDVTLFNKAYENRYVSHDEMRKIIERTTHTILLQEYKPGIDYSVSAVAVNGKVTHLCGYAGYAMERGAIVIGEIVKNDAAYCIVERLCNEIGLDGNVCFDFRMSDNGDVSLLEINPRVNASLPFVREAGINMLYLRCKNMLGDYSDVAVEYPIRYGLKMKKYHESRYFV